MNPAFATACPDLDQTFDSPYCVTLPGQLRAWDATALRLFMECPRKFQLAQLEGWQRVGGGIHLEFGTLYHEATEMFDKLRLAGWDKEAATWSVMSHFTYKTIGKLDTAYLPVWRCSSPAVCESKRKKDEDGLPAIVRNTKQCRLAKEAQYEGGHRESEPCPDCGLPTTDDWEMVALDKNKNRNTLLRTILFYCDTSDDRVRPYQFPDGTVAVELSFRIPLPLTSPDGTPYLLCGNMDGMVEFAGEVVPRERKTTKGTPGLYFFDRYAPDVQIDTYDLAAWLYYSDLLDPKPHGVMVEVTQVTQSFTRIERQIVTVPEERRAEWLEELQWWIKQAEACARAGKWPKNTSACNANGGCPFRRICRMAPSSRAAFLPSESFEKRERLWNPMETR